MQIIHIVDDRIVGGVFAVNFFPELHLRFETAGNGKVILTQGLGSLRGGGQGRGERVENQKKYKEQYFGSVSGQIYCLSYIQSIR